MVPLSVYRTLNKNHESIVFENNYTRCYFLHCHCVFSRLTPIQRRHMINFITTDNPRARLEATLAILGSESLGEATDTASVGQNRNNFRIM